jgi:stearoyl-CoA desaturase (delta-9 desaturase)
MAQSLTAAPRTIQKLSSTHFGYIGVHLAALLGIAFTGVTWHAITICLASYFIRHLGLVLGFHRYFAHRSFKTSRPMQFLLALYGTLCFEKGVLWWAQTHRYHHRHADKPEDLHSPRHQGFLYSHSGWFLDASNRHADLSQIPDLAKFPELIWVDKWSRWIVILFAIAMFIFLGWTGLVWGFFVSTVMIWHTTHMIQSVSHAFGGYRRFPTDDDSRNHWWLGVIALGDGWHNNHHYYPSSARQGFAWWEIDITYYILKIMSWMGLVWDLHVPPARVLRGEISASS